MSAKAPPCANHGFGSLSQELPEPHQRRGARRAGSDLALGHNQHSTTHCLLLSGSGRGRLLPLLVGWYLSRWIDTRLTLSALETALWLRLPELELIHHSDQGVQYASSEYVARLKNADVLISMAAVGNPYENVKAESFFQTLKTEEVYIKDYRRFEFLKPTSPTLSGPLSSPSPSSQGSRSPAGTFHA